ncbi:olfactory receptor 13-like [Tachyglossus aculeatus]|uniref:olfactory receptor 13-like n=1 Tax=Tachyglossus aculeatus TaxID=9261 RepID=UPI0018F689C8|nr:olfactory receptor 13-like [Tachyglossus aculeatus]
MGPNRTSVSEFLLLGFADHPKMQLFLFGLFSLLYTTTLLGNGVILGLVWLDGRLHTPMYFFLCHLAVVDISYACNTVPQMLVNLLRPAEPISFAGCSSQTFLFLTLAHTECFLLLVMSYDRFMAICRPLRYPLIMSRRACGVLVGLCWALGSLLALLHLLLLLRLPFCGRQEIDHFFCEILALLRAACGDARINEALVLAGAVLVLVGPFFSILTSYLSILRAILRLRSREGRRKAFSTCASHLGIVGLFYGTALVTYVGPGTENPGKQEKYLLLFHSLLNPMLNPMIYSLKNGEVKKALREVMKRARAP